MLFLADKIPEEQQKAEEMQMFTELFHEWKGMPNSHHHTKLPRLYDKVSADIMIYAVILKLHTKIYCDN